MIKPPEKKQRCLNDIKEDMSIVQRRLHNIEKDIHKMKRLETILFIFVFSLFLLTLVI